MLQSFPSPIIGRYRLRASLSMLTLAVSSSNRHRADFVLVYECQQIRINGPGKRKNLVESCHASGLI